MLPPFTGLYCGAVLGKQVVLVVATAVVVLHGAGKTHSLQGDSVIFSYSGPSGIFGSGGKQTTTNAGARGRENCCSFY